MSINEFGVNTHEPTALTVGSGSLIFADFASEGESASITGHGWSAQEEDGRWMIGPYSELVLPPTQIARDYWLQVLLEPYVCPPLCRGQPLALQINGQRLGSCFIERRTTLLILVSHEFLRVGEPVKIIIEHAGFAVPNLFGPHSDDRPLALFVRGVWFWTDGLFDGTPFRRDFGAPSVTVNLAPERSDYADSARKPGVEKFSFGSTGAIAPYLRSGWDGGEDGYTWTVEKRAAICLPYPKFAGPLLITMSLGTSLINGADVSQTFSVGCSGRILGQFNITGAESISFPLPSDIRTDSDTFLLEFEIPGAVSPRVLGFGDDSRLLGLNFNRLEIETVPNHILDVCTRRYAFAALPIPPVQRSALFLDVSRETWPTVISDGLSMSLEELIKRSEGLGDNCEFGIVQRKLGVEVLGLLRFANIRLRSLVDSLSDDFVSAKDPSSAVFSLNNADPREYSMSLPEYDIRWHTFIFEGTELADKDRSSQIAKLSYLRRRFYEGLASERKIYVLKTPSACTIDRIIPVLVALNRFGRNWLLVVSTACDGHKAGTVELIGPGLMRGYIDRFAPDNDVETADAYSWLSILANAWTLYLSARGSS